MCVDCGEVSSMLLQQAISYLSSSPDMEPIRIVHGNYIFKKSGILPYNFHDDQMTNILKNIGLHPMDTKFMLISARGFTYKINIQYIYQTLVAGKHENESESTVYTISYSMYKYKVKLLQLCIDNIKDRERSGYKYNYNILPNDLKGYFTPMFSQK
jgi:hypothetical protein